MNQNATFPAKVTATTFSGALSGNAATATKLATARTISLTGAVTGSGTFDGSGNLSIATTMDNNNSNYVKKSGDTMAGNLTAPSVYTSNWFRSTGATGWYSESYGGGIWMNDSTWIRTYGGKNFYCDATMGSYAHLYTDGYFRCSGDSYTYGHMYIGGNNKVHLWEDGEGGNIQLVAPDGHEIQMDMYDSQNFRIYSFNDAGSYVGISMRRSDGHFFALI